MFKINFENLIFLIKIINKVIKIYYFNFSSNDFNKKTFKNQNCFLFPYGRFQKDRKKMAG
jgi:hypothetical protein